MQEKTKDSFFNPERRCKTERSKAWVKVLIETAMAFEAQQGLRKRKRRLADQERVEDQIEALISDVTYTLLYAPKGKTGSVCLSLSKQNLGPKQDGHRLVNSVLGDTLALLAESGIGVLEVTKGSIKTGLQTTLKAAKSLKASIKKLELQTSDFHTLKERPLVQLRAKNPKTNRARLVPIDPSDSELIRMTAELVEINDFLSQADIVYHGSDPKADERDRKIYRVFNNSLKNNGQLYGGFWAGLVKEDRKGYLYIDDEPCIEIDLNAAQLQIAYGLAGVAKTGDYYEIPGLERLGRDTVKTYTLMYLNGGIEAFNHPLSTKVYRFFSPHEDESEARVLLRLLTVIRDHHKPIAQYLNPNKAPYLTYILGEVFVSTILNLAKHDVVALPLGDAIYVKESAKDQALKVLQQCFSTKTGSKQKITTGS